MALNQQRIIPFFYRKVNKNDQLGTEFFVHQRFESAFKRTEFVSDNMSYTVRHFC